MTKSAGIRTTPSRTETETSHAAHSSTKQYIRNWACLTGPELADVRRLLHYEPTTFFTFDMPATSAEGIAWGRIEIREGTFLFTILPVRFLVPPDYLNLSLSLSSLFPSFSFLSYPGAFNKERYSYFGSGDGRPGTHKFHFTKILCKTRSWGSSSSTVSDYRLDERGLIPGRGKPKDFRSFIACAPPPLKCFMNSTPPLTE
jgi:hypothetical protein